MRAKRTLLIGLIASGTGMAANPGKEAVPLFFIENQGQAPSAIRFMAKGSGVTAYFSAGEAKFCLSGASVRLDFEGANPAARVEGMDRLPSHANFLIGARENWRMDVPTYGAIRYRELYPGIDMTYGGTGRDLKSEFVVAPGADTARIRMRYLGAGELRIEESGELVIPLSARESAPNRATKGARELREQAPILYQEYDGKRVAVDGRFVLLDGHGVGFTVGKYDLARPLVIDPVLSYSTLLGGSGFDSATAMAVDSAGSAYVAGFTDSYDLPAVSPEQNFNAGGNDVFVAKLNPSGKCLVYCTYLGGRGDDRAYGIAVDASGSAYVTGTTASTNFPVHNALQSSLAGGRNAFVAKLNAAGNMLVFSTYLGGNGSDTGYGIALDGSGNAYIVGDTTSINFQASGVQKGYHGAQDAFVAKIGADGSRLLYSTYLGGGNTDHGAAIAVDSGGSVYVTGSTWSTDFPVANALQSSNAGGQDAFLARLSADGNTLLFSTWLGGSGGTVAYPEAGQAIALDGQGNAYVTGVTSSPDFPRLHALQSARGGFTDAFVSKVSASGVLAYSTYLGGSGVEMGNAIVVDSGGGAFVAGYTYSTDLPVVNAIQPVMAGDCDAFLAHLSPVGDSLSYLSYLGGNGSDTATALALDLAGAVYVAGWTLSSNFPLLNPSQSTNAGNYGAFVTKMVIIILPASMSVTKTHSGSFRQGQNGAAYSVTVSNGAGTGATSGTVTVTESIPTGLTLVSMSGTGWTCPSGGATCARGDPLAGGGSYPAITVIVNVSPSAPTQLTNQVSVSGGGSATASAADPTTIAALCSYSLSPASALVAFNSGAGTLSVTASAACPWTALSNTPWLTVTSGASGSGNGIAGYWFAANPNGTPRAGTLTAAGWTFTVTQAGVPIGPANATSRVGVFDNGLWFLATDTGGISKVIGFGSPTSTPVTGDWDGTGTTKIGVFDHGLWFLANAAGGIYKIIGFGSLTAIPVVGDWDGNGTTNIGVFDHGLWFLANDAGGIFEVIGFGSPTAISVVGDWDGTGTTKVGVFDHGLWFLANAAGGIFKVIGFGGSTATPVVGDWDGTGTAKIGVFDHGLWYLANSSGGIYRVIGFGALASKPMIGDWDGNGTANIGVFDNGLWYLANDSGGIYKLIGFGSPAATPVAGRW
jgi:uncharacterized repeat protein (TIGR01451 family)